MKKEISPSVLYKTLLCVALILPSLIFAKNHNKQYNLALKQYRIGDYKRAIYHFQNVIDLIPVNKEEKDKYVNAYLYHAQATYIYNGVNLDQVEKDITLALDNAKSFFSPTSDANFHVISFASQVYTEVGLYKKALGLINQGKKIDPSNKEIQLAEAFLNYNIGYFDKSLETFYQLKNYKEGNITQTRTYEDSNQGIKKKISKKALTIRKQEYARYLLRIAHIEFLKGDYHKAMEELNEVETWAESNLKRKNIVQVDIYYERSQIEYALYQPIKALASIKMAMLSNENLGKHRYMSSHKVYMNILEQEMLYLWQSERFNNNNNHEANQAKHLYHIQAKNIEFYHTEGLNTLRNDLITIKKQIIKKRLKKAKEKYKKLELLAEKRLPKNHRFLFELYQLGQNIFIEAESLSKINSLSKKIAYIVDKNFIKGSPIYHKHQLDKAIQYFHYQDKFNEANIIFKESFENNVQKEYHPMHKEYLYYMTQYANLNALANHFSKANEIHNEAITITKDENNFGNVSFPYDQQSIHKANFLIGYGKFNEAVTIIDGIIHKYDITNLSEVKKEFKPSALAQSNRALMRMAIHQEDFTNFEDYREKYEDYMSDLGSKPNRYSINEVLDFAPYYIAKGNYITVKRKIEDHISKIKKNYSTTDRRLILPLSYLSLINTETGQYIDAEKKVSEAESIILQKFGKSHLLFAENSLMKGIINIKTGDFFNAYHNLETALSIRESLIGKDNLGNAKIHGLHAMTKMYAAQAENKLNNTTIKIIENELIDAQRMIKRVFNNVPSKYNHSLSFYDHNFLETYFYINIKELGKAESILEELSNAGASVLKKSQRGELALIKAQINLHNKHYKSADKNISDAKRIYKSLYDETHPKYIEALALSGRLAYAQGNLKNAISTAEQTTDIYSGYINTTFQYLSDREKKDYWFNVLNPGFEFYKTLAFEQKKDKYLKKVYNHTLQTKGILLSSSKKVKNRILSSNDPLLINTYEKWQELVNKYNVSITLNEVELKEEEIDVNDLQKRINTLEKRLNQQSADFKGQHRTKRITTEEVSKSLADNEYAIEIIRYRHFENTFTDSIVYVALILDNKSSTPKAVYLENGNNIEKRMVKYFRNVIRYQLKDKYSYDTFWKGIHNIVGDNSTVYLSTDGVYAKINVEAIPTPDGQYIIDKNKIILVSNTKDILKHKKERKNNTLPTTALLIANPNYYEANSTNNPDHQNLDFSQSHSQLPGAEEEVLSIEKTLKNKNIRTSTYIFNDATEELFRTAVKGKQIVHIATHGFFIDKKEASDLLSLDKNRALDNPLLQSGFLLKYGGDLADSLDFRQYNKYSGIVTANEIMAMDFESTQIVVMSACETGLGKNENGQGVQGLQSAFLTAGAKTLIMSIFKVEDAVTKLLMETFDKEYLISNDKQDALLKAKKIIKEKYKEPIYWASFIMIQ